VRRELIKRRGNRSHEKRRRVGRAGCCSREGKEENWKEKEEQPTKPTLRWTQNNFVSVQCTCHTTNHI